VAHTIVLRRSVGCADRMMNPVRSSRSSIGVPR
jgi:hypothetical protein